MHQTEIRRPWTGLCRGSDSTDSGSAESQRLPLALCLRHLALAGGEEEEAVVEGGVEAVTGVHNNSSSPPILLCESAKTLLFGT